MRTELEKLSAQAQAKARGINSRARSQALVEKGRRDRSTEFFLQVLPRKRHRDGLLLGVEKDFTKQLGHGRHDPRVAQEDVVRLHQRPSCLERLVLSPELFQANNTVDKLDVVRREKILVFSLRVLDK